MRSGGGALSAPVHCTDTVDVDHPARDVGEQLGRVEPPERFRRDEQRLPDHRCCFGSGNSAASPHRMPRCPSPIISFGGPTLQRCSEIRSPSKISLGCRFLGEGTWGYAKSNWQCCCG